MTHFIIKPLFIVADPFATNNANDGFSGFEGVLPEVKEEDIF